MRKFIIFSIVILFFVSVTSIFAQPQNKKGASQEAYEHASEQSIFNRVGDWFSTIGKSSEEREEILRERRAEREARREKREEMIRERKAERETKREGREEAEKGIRRQERGREQAEEGIKQQERKMRGPQRQKED